MEVVVYSILGLASWETKGGFFVESVGGPELQHIPTMKNIIENHLKNGGHESQIRARSTDADACLQEPGTQEDARHAQATQ